VKFYIHPINPHYSATHADEFRQGWQYGIWEYPYPAPEPFLYRLQSKNLAAAQDVCSQAEAATVHMADVRVRRQRKVLLEGADPHSEAAAVSLIQLAVCQRYPVQWPWTKQR